ncbi:MAG TPA: ABC transporter permease [Casimicrobiaceae bacterium]|nr:ABC transporter permease [Casimicrobiaceae bacterium]
MAAAKIGLRSRGAGLVWLAPVLLVFAAFYVVPLARMVLTSLDAPQFNFDHYRYVLHEDLYATVLLITLKISLYVTVLALIIGYPIGYYLSQLRGLALTIALALVLLPFWTSVLVRNYAWLVLLSRRGIVNSILLALGITDQPLSLLFNTTAVVIGITYVLVPFMILSVFSVARAIDPIYVKASASLGASPMTTFWRVFFPLSLPGVYAGVILVFVTAIGFFITPALLGGGRVPMIAVLIENQVRGVLNFGVGSALGTMLLIAVLGIYYVFDRFFGAESLMGAKA